MKIAMIGSGAAGSVFAADLRKGGAELWLVDNFQRTEQVIGRIICIGQPVCTVVDETVFGRKAVIEAVQFRLLLGNGAVRNRCVHLKVDQFLHTIPQSL